MELFSPSFKIPSCSCVSRAEEMLVTVSSEVKGRTVQYGAQFSATKNVNLYFLPWNSRKDLKFQRQVASAFSLHM